MVKLGIPLEQGSSCETDTLVGCRKDVGEVRQKILEASRQTRRRDLVILEIDVRCIDCRWKRPCAKKTKEGTG